MKRVSRHIRVSLVTILAVLIAAYPAYAAATTAPTLSVISTPDVIITEFQTNGGFASQEFIELYNTTDTDIDFDDASNATDSWRLQFFNSTSVKQGLPTWAATPGASNSVLLSGVISAHDYFLIASTDYKPLDMPADLSYDPASSHVMTDTGGGLQLLSSADSTTGRWLVHDRLMWLDETTNPILPGGVLARPGIAYSQQRIPNEDQEYTDPNGGLMNFEMKDDITPLSPWIAPVPPVATPVDSTTDIPVPVDTPPDPGSTPPIESPVTDAGQSPETQATGGSQPIDAPTDSANSTASQPIVTELLPNPGSPLTDASDEFIEIYNPNQSSIDLKNYAIEVGTTTLHSFVFSETTVVPAQSYRAFYSSDTKLSLTNSGGQARLRDATGAMVSETAVYGTAVDNVSWTLSNGLWQWSTTPTPNIANVLTTSPPKDPSKTSANTSQTATPITKKLTSTKTTSKTASKSASKQAAVKGKTSAKKPKTTSSKKKAKSTKVTTHTAASISKPKPPIHTGVLVAVGGIAVLYGLYEYRHDIANAIARRRRDGKISRADRQQVAWQ